MKPNILGSRGTKMLDSDWTQESTLDSEDRYKVRQVKRTFRFSNLLLHPSSLEEGLFLLDYELQRVGVENSGQSQNPVTPPLLLRFKAQGRELATLSGILGREVEIEEDRRISAKTTENLESELQRLREELKESMTENQALKQYFMETQRPKRVS